MKYSVTFLNEEDGVILELPCEAEDLTECIEGIQEVLKQERTRPDIKAAAQIMFQLADRAG